MTALRSCSLVSKRWRRSATLNYCWYTYVHSDVLTGGGPGGASAPVLPAFGSGGARWTRRESKVDWLTHLASQRQREARALAREMGTPMSGSGTNTPTRSQRLEDSGARTAAVRNEEKWTAEEQSSQWSKTELRDYYKSQGTKGGKLKGKSGKGGVKTGSREDGGLWE